MLSQVTETHSISNQPMNNLFEKPIKDMSDDELLVKIDNIPWEMVHVPLGELTRRNLQRLQQIITVFNEQASKQAHKMIVLTWCIVFLTIAMFVGLITQIILNK
jgi:hypothetical protein